MNCSALYECTATRSSGWPTAVPWPSSSSPTRTTSICSFRSSTPSPFRHIALKVDAAGQAELERRLNEAEWSRTAISSIEHGNCRSLYTNDPNGMMLEFTVDVDGYDEIKPIRARTPTRP